MAKVKRERCQHGLSPVYMQGCPHCVQTAMTGLGIMQDNGLEPEDLWELLRMAYINKDTWDAAVVTAKERVRVARSKAGVQ